jgi:hypothetical protein
MNTARKAVGVTVLVLFLTISSTGLIRYASAFVNIVSPSKGETVPAGSSLTVSGTSDDTAQFNCKIMVIVNDKRPYQETMPVGLGDYSKWTFVVNPQYAEIEQGINTITSKASCDAPYESFLKLDPITKEYVKHYSINVTGVPAGPGVGSQEPSVEQAPREDSGGGEDGETSSGDSLFG